MSPQGRPGLALPRCVTCKQALNYVLSWTEDGDFVWLAPDTRWTCPKGHPVGRKVLAPLESGVDKFDLVPSASDDSNARNQEGRA